MLKNKNILLIISGGIAAYKALELIRLLRQSDATVRCILTKSAEQFVTPMSVAALSEQPVYNDLWSLKDETEMGHIRLSRDADLIVVAPATANILAKMAHGLADDLASTCLLAANKPVLVCPAMNPEMWAHPATQDNIRTLKSRKDITLLEPEAGEMACGEIGIGRLPEPTTILEAMRDHFGNRPLNGIRVLITNGATQEPIDPVRYISNHSSGKQGAAIAHILNTMGAEVTVIQSSSAETLPSGVTHIDSLTASDMAYAVEAHLKDSHIFISVAAVSDWTPEAPNSKKIKKESGQESLSLNLTKTTDILHMVGHHKDRPVLVIGFAAETDNLKAHAKEKQKAKSCDWLLANDVSSRNNVFGSDHNHVHFFGNNETYEDWQKTTKTEVAAKLADKICNFLKERGYHDRGKITGT